MDRAFDRSLETLRTWVHKLAQGRSRRPRGNQFTSGIDEIGDVAGSEPRAARLGDRRNHRVRDRHWPSRPHSPAHENPIRQGSRLVEAKDAVGVTASKVMEIARQTPTPRLVPDLLNANAISR